MSDVTETARMGRRRREPDDPVDAGRVVDAALAEELVSRAREQGIELLGENGLLRQMTKAVLERGLAEELTEHLGYEPHERARTSNARNGSTPKRLHSEAGTIDLDVPRDRAGTFEPRLVRNTAARSEPSAGQKSFRIYGGDSKAGGGSWSPVDPRTVGNNRNAAGLPSGGASGATNAGSSR